MSKQTQTKKLLGNDVAAVPIRIELPIEFNMGSVNAYLFTEPEPVLVDTGVDSEASWAALEAGLAARGLQAADLQRVIITHPHVDHFGQAARLAQVSGAPVWIADLGLGWLLRPKKMFHARLDFYEDHFLRQAGLSAEMSQMIITYMRRVAETAAPVPHESIEVFQVGDSLRLGGRPWQVLHMPGHASHQTCFYQPETRRFLSADMLLPKTPTPIVERPPDGKTHQPSLPIFLDSLDRCEALDIETVYPGHGEPFGDHRFLIQKQRNRIHKRKQQARALIQQGHRTPSELVDIMYAHYPVQSRFAGLWMLIGYLDLLQAEGAITEKTVDGVWHYYVNQ